MKQWIIPTLLAVALGVALMFWLGEIPLKSHHHDHYEEGCDFCEEEYLNNIPDKELTDKDRKAIESLKDDVFE
jgi:hypothetical protein